MKGPAWNKWLATRMKDETIGIYRDVRSPSWPVNEGFQRLHFGFADPVKQRDYILAHPSVDFELVTKGDREYWLSNYKNLIDIPNIKGLGGSNIPLSMFENWPDLTYVFMGGGCQDFRAHKFPKLRSIRGGFLSTSDMGIGCHPALCTIHAAYFPQGRVNLGNLGDIPNLKNVGLIYGRYHDLSFLEGAENVEVLSLRGATQLRTFSGIEAVPDLRFLWVEDARRLESVAELFQLSKLETVFFNSCKKVSGLQEFGNHIVARGGFVSL